MMHVCFLQKGLVATELSIDELYSERTTLAHEALKKE